MVYMAEWDSMLFLACPIMKELNNLVWSGLFINDLRLAASIFNRNITCFCPLSHDKDCPSSSVADPDPYIFGPPGSGSGSISQRFGSGSRNFYHQEKL
jgi:hypothetical protein